MNIVKPTRAERALEAHRSSVASNGVGLCGQVAVCLALDLIDAGHDAIVETALCTFQGARAAHAYVVVGDTAIDATTSVEDDADEYRDAIRVDRSTLVAFNRTALRRIAKRAANEAALGVGLFKASSPAVYAHVRGND